MQTLNNLDQVDRRNAGHDACRSPLRRGHRGSAGSLIGRLAQGVTRFGAGLVLGRHLVCHIAAMVFCVVVVVPLVLVFGNRTLPFDYIEVAFVEKAARPGEFVQIRFLTGTITSSINGEFDRIFYDGAGRPQFLGTFPTIYNKLTTVGEPQPFYKDFQIPANATEGDALYITKPRFWHNEVQRWLYPIEAPPQKARIWIIRRAGGN